MKNSGIARMVAVGLGFLFSPYVLSPPLRSTAASANWPQWRGPDGAGVSGDSKLPSEWGPDRNILWKTPVPGRGHSSPIVWGSRVFLTTDVEGPVLPGAKAVTHIVEGKEFKHPDSIGGDRKHSLRVLCFDKVSGRILWERTAYEGTVYDDRHRKGSYAAPTPTTDGKRVFAWFGSEGIYCYDLDGKQIWKKAVGPIATLGMGPGTSPILFENLLILLCDEDNGDKSLIMALDKRTGREVWRTARKVEASWATPLLVRSPSRAEIVCSGIQTINAYDPRTGTELWRMKGLDSNAIPSPVAGHGMVFVSSGFPAKKTFAVKLGGSGDLTDTPFVAWHYEKGTAYVPSTLLYGEFLYLMTDRGILTCVDARTGSVKYDNGRIPVPATFTASPVAVDGKILLTSEDGDTYVIKAGPEHQVLAANSVGEPVYASPAIADGRLFIRGEQHLFCIGSK
jgi:outer membrane protein assembly factor BamB